MDMLTLAAKVNPMFAGCATLLCHLNPPPRSGYQGYHDAFQNAILKGDVSNLEAAASTSGSDAASVLCYLDPYYDGNQPGECPTMYFRDVGAVMENLDQHTMWVALEAASGIVSEHDYDPNS